LFDELNCLLSRRSKVRHFITQRCKRPL
jgi:hypothetical protein